MGPLKWIFEFDYFLQIDLPEGAWHKRMPTTGSQQLKLVWETGQTSAVVLLFLYRWVTSRIVVSQQFQIHLFRSGANDHEDDILVICGSLILVPVVYDFKGFRGYAISWVYIRPTEYWVFCMIQGFLWLLGMVQLKEIQELQNLGIADKGLIVCSLSPG